MMNLIPLLSFSLNVIILIVSACCFIKIMKNDLIHVQKDLTELKNTIVKLDEKVDNLSEKIALFEGKLKVIKVRQR